MRVVNYTIQNDTLYIYYGNDLICEISDVRSDINKIELENLIDDVLTGLGYKWNLDGTIENY